MQSRQNSSGLTKRPSTSSRPQSWIPSEIHWTKTSGLVGLRVSIDFDLLEFIANGSREIVLLPEDVCSNLEDLELYAGCLNRQLLIAANAQTLLRPSIEYSDEEIRTVMLHLHGVFVLPCLGKCLVLIGREPLHSSGGWLSERLKDKAVEICAEYNATRVAHEKDQTERLAELPPQLRDDVERLSGYGGDFGVPPRPEVSRSWMMSLCPKAVAIASRREDWSRQLENLALSAIAQSGWPPSRDGQYEGILPLMTGRDKCAIVVWEPYWGLPAYPEVRWCVQRMLPRALHKPRATRSERPKFELTDDMDHDH